MRTKPSFPPPASLASRASSPGVALVTTLAVLVLITIIVVTMTTMTRLERTSSSGSFEAEHAKTFALIAVDEVTSKLRDNIPTNGAWAAAPGQIVAYKGGSWVTTPLYSGTPSGSPGTSIALNRPGLGASASYPIVPSNPEYASPNPMTVAWINVLQDGTRSTDAAYSPTTANPIVGRYAYWVDTETSKVNLNTAGKAKTTYNFHLASGDPQNFTAQPNRVDLSQLDGGITSAQSLATYEYTASSIWTDANLGGDQAAPAPRTAGTGMHRFNTIDEWTRASGLNPAITAAQVEQNKFYLTTQARAPELTPWGLNRLWWQSCGAQLVVSPTPSLLGNRLNAPGAPGYVTTAATVPAPRDAFPDVRYFVYPMFLGNDTNSANNTSMQNLQWMEPYDRVHNNGTNGPQNFIKNMTDPAEGPLGRRDWPGMPAVSFIDKYGQQECEDLALNMLYLYDSAVNGAGLCAGDLFPTLGSNDPVGLYGNSLVSYTPTNGTPRLMSGMGAFPYINEVAVSFTPTLNGYTPNALNGNTSTTKDNTRPGFCPPLPATGSNYMNIDMSPEIELYYPPSLAYKNDFTTWYNGGGYKGYLGICDIEVTATGTYNSQPVTYTGEQYYWGFPDDKPTSPTPAPGGTPVPTPPPHGLWWQTFPFDITPSTTPYYPLSNKHYYIGPFDKATTANVTTKFRAYFSRQNSWTGQPPLEIVPLGYNYQGYAGSVAPFPGAVPPNAAPAKLSFVTTVDLTSPVASWKSFEAVDPRVYRYVQDWVPCAASAGNTLGFQNQAYVSSYTDPLTGVVGDPSKFTWPDVAAPVYRLTKDYLTGNSDTNPADPRWWQNAGNVVSFPGMGWLSVLPTNLEASAGNGGHPLPWRTLSFGPESQANQLPDWLLLDAFAMAYEQTYLSQTSGKVNVNAKIAPFGFNRTKPLQALLIPSSQNGNTVASTIANDMAAATSAQLGPGANLPNNLYVYAGQICQLASMQGSGTNQWQREALARDVAGLVTTQCSDFLAHIVAQSLHKDGSVAGEQRLDATISRTVDVGPDGVPGTGDDLAGPDRVAGTSDDLTFKSDTGATINQLKYDATDPPLEGKAGRPPFHYQITNLHFITQ